MVALLPTCCPAWAVVACLATFLEILVSHCTGPGCRMLNIEDLQNAELWQRAGLLTVDKQAIPEQYNSKQTAADVLQSDNADELSH